MTDIQRVLITGAAGRIGSFLRPRLARPGRVLRLLDVERMESRSSHEEIVHGSIADVRVMELACRDVDALIHLGGCSEEAPWDVIQETNIRGTQLTYEAARQARIQRIVYASSIHAVGFFPVTEAPATDYLFPAPDTYYGVSKVTGEALGSLYHHRYGMDVICLRIMTCTERPADCRALATWLSPDDAGRLFEASLSIQNPGFRVAWGVSANKRRWCSMDEASALGYVPLDDAEVFFSEIKDGTEGESTSYDYIGGAYTSSDFDVEKVHRSVSGGRKGTKLAFISWAHRMCDHITTWRSQSA